jgi:hypothetical protein
MGAAAEKVTSTLPCSPPAIQTYLILGSPFAFPFCSVLAEDRSSSEPGGPGLWLSTVTLGTQLLRLLIVACKGPGGARRSLGSAGGCRACGRRDRQTGPHTGDSRAREQEQVSLGPSGCQPLQTSSLGPFLWELRTAQRPEPAKE